MQHCQLRRNATNNAPNAEPDVVKTNTGTKRRAELHKYDGMQNQTHFIA